MPPHQGNKYIVKEVNEYWVSPKRVEDQERQSTHRIITWWTKIYSVSSVWATNIPSLRDLPYRRPILLPPVAA
jgi:hypothetical protein